MRFPTGAGSLITILILLLGLSAVAQTGSPSALDGPCALPLFSHKPQGHNLFNEQQEEWLGEIMDQGLRKNFHVIEDPEGRLQHIADRLLAQLPPTTVHYRLVIVDSPQLNSFGLPGGRIYIFRRMIAFARNEDQLAGLVGHEIGHMIVHQMAFDISGWFRQLGITEVSNRQDIFDKWNRFRDNAAKIKIDPDEKRRREEQNQVIADQIAVYALIRAGYDPSQFAQFADRTFETRGKTGNFWTDLFGATSPESKRLRQLIHDAPTLPANCLGSHPDTSAFNQWQQRIVESQRESAHVELAGLVNKVKLQPPLRSEISNLQFSPDGRYLIAQDESTIFVLARDPFANLFRIEATDSHPAAFTPDSSAIVFYDNELRVQRWDLATQQRTSIWPVQANCAHTALSPHGDVLACVTSDRELQMLDVKTSNVIFSKKKLYDQTAEERALGNFVTAIGLNVGRLFLLPVILRFSPDGHYLVAGHGGFAFAYNCTARDEVKVPDKLRPLTAGNFSFIAPDEIFGLDRDTPRHAVRLRFPGGEVLDRFPFPPFGAVSRSGKAGYVMIRPAGQAPIGVIDLAQKKVVMGYKVPGFAVYENFFAGEDVDGELKLYSLETKGAIAQVQLPISFVSRSRASVFSPDGKWLALSGLKRGAVWNLETGARIAYSPEFSGAFFDEGQLIAEFPRQTTQPEQVVQLNLSTLGLTRLYELATDDEDKSESSYQRYFKAHYWQEGDLLVYLQRTDPKKPTQLTLELRDIRTNVPIWQLDPEKQPAHFYYFRDSSTLTFVLADYERIKEAAKNNPTLKAKLEAVRGREGKQDSYLVEVFEPRSHKQLGAVLVDTGNLSFKVRSAFTAGGNVFVSDSLNRTLIYSLATGEQRSKIVGRLAAVSAAGDKLLVDNGGGIAQLYDGSNLTALSQFTFPSSISHAEFTTDRNLMVLTADQTVYRLRLDDAVEKSASANH